MSRDGSGTFSVINTFTPGSVMSATAVNQNFSDAGGEITNSLARDGQSSMNGQLKLYDGTTTASTLPGLAFGADVNTGIYRPSADRLDLVTGGITRLYIDTAGKIFALNGLEVTGTVSISNALVIATSSVTPLTLRRTENDATARAIETYASGDGSGATADMQVIGDGLNAVSALRWRVNSVAVFETTQTLFTHDVDVAIGSNLRLSTSGYIDLTEIAEPSAPAANTIRLYAVDSAGVSRMAYKRSDGQVITPGQTTDVQTFDTTGTWTKPGVGTVAFVQAWGAGASGAKGSADGGGGGGGSYMEKLLVLASVSASVSVTVGGGGATVTTADTAGVAGGNTTFGSYLSVFGGGGGASGGGGGGGGGLSGAGTAGSGATGGAGGEPSGVIGSNNTGAAGNSNPFGGGGGGSTTAAGGVGLYGGGGGGGGEASGTAGNGGVSIFGGGGGGGGGDSSFGAGGAGVVYGGNGGAGGSGVTSGTAGTAPGGGGGGCDNAAAQSGAGAAGRVRITVL